MASKRTTIEPHAGDKRLSAGTRRDASTKSKTSAAPSRRIGARRLGPWRNRVRGTRETGSRAAHARKDRASYIKSDIRASKRRTGTRRQGACGASLIPPRESRGPKPRGRFHLGYGSRIPRRARSAESRVGPDENRFGGNLRGAVEQSEGARPRILAARDGHRPQRRNLDRTREWALR